MPIILFLFISDASKGKHRYYFYLGLKIWLPPNPTFKSFSKPFAMKSWKFLVFYYRQHGVPSSETQIFCKIGPDPVSWSFSGPSVAGNFIYTMLVQIWIFILFFLLASETTACPWPWWPPVWPGAKKTTATGGCEDHHCWGKLCTNGSWGVWTEKCFSWLCLQTSF